MHGEKSTLRFEQVECALMLITTQYEAAPPESALCGQCDHALTLHGDTGCTYLIPGTRMNAPRLCDCAHHTGALN
jgi:hypothetical protein